MLTHQEILKKLEHAITENLDIECIDEITTDFYTLFDLPRYKLEVEILNKTYRKLALFCHPDKGNYPNRQAFMRYVNNARDILLNPIQKNHYDNTLPRLSQGSGKSLYQRQRERSMNEELTELSTQGANIPVPPGYSEVFFQANERASFAAFAPIRPDASHSNPLTPPGNSGKQNCYLMFFCITDGSAKERHTKAGELIKQYVEEKKSGTGHLFHNKRLSDKTETVTFSFSQAIECKFDDDDENFLILTLSTEKIMLDETIIKSASRSYTTAHPECKTSLAKASFFCCCL